MRSFVGVEVGFLSKPSATELDFANMRLIGICFILAVELYVHFNRRRVVQVRRRRIVILRVVVYYRPLLIGVVVVELNCPHKHVHTGIQSSLALPSVVHAGWGYLRFRRSVGCQRCWRRDAMFWLHWGAVDVVILGATLWPLLMVCVFLRSPTFPRREA